LLFVILDLMAMAAWITAFGIIVGAIVTLSIAYMHRKQMRQIELHRIDPNVPVIPPQVNPR